MQFNNNPKFCLQFDIVGLASGSASSLYKMSDLVLVWLYVWSEMQMIHMWSSWCHCHGATHLASLKCRMAYLSGASLCRLSWKRSH